MTKHKSVVFLLLLCLSLPAAAQVTWENQIWSSVEMEKKILPKTRASLTLEARWNVDPLMAVRYFPNLAVSRKWSDLFSTELHYRYITANKGLGYHESSHRLMLDGNPGATTWLSELICRDFSFHILHLHPHVVELIFNPAYDTIPL